MRRVIVPIAVGALFLAGLWALDAVAQLGLQLANALTFDPGAAPGLLALGSLLVSAAALVLGNLVWTARSALVGVASVAAGIVVLAIPVMTWVRCPVGTFGGSLCQDGLEPLQFDMTAGPSAHILAGAMVAVGVAVLVRIAVTGRRDEAAA
jgi:hypothetical protein